MTKNMEIELQGRQFVVSVQPTNRTYDEQGKLKELVSFAKASGDTVFALIAFLTGSFHYSVNAIENLNAHSDEIKSALFAGDIQLAINLLDSTDIKRTDAYLITLKVALWFMQEHNLDINTGKLNNLQSARDFYIGNYRINSATVESSAVDDFIRSSIEELNLPQPAVLLALQLAGAIITLDTSNTVRAPLSADYVISTARKGHNISEMLDWVCRFPPEDRRVVLPFHKGRSHLEEISEMFPGLGLDLTARIPAWLGLTNWKPKSSAEEDTES